MNLLLKGSAAPISVWGRGGGGQKHNSSFEERKNPELNYQTSLPFNGFYHIFWLPIGERGELWWWREGSDIEMGGGGWIIGHTSTNVLLKRLYHLFSCLQDGIDLRGVAGINTPQPSFEVFCCVLYEMYSE